MTFHQLDYLNPPDRFYKRVNQIFHKTKFPDNLGINVFQINQLRENQQPYYGNNKYRSGYNSHSYVNNYRNNNKSYAYQDNYHKKPNKSRKFEANYKKVRDQGKQLYELSIPDNDNDDVNFTDLDASETISDAPYESDNDSIPESFQSDHSARQPND